MTRNLALSAFFFLPLSAFSSEVVKQAIPIVPEYDLSAELGFLYKSASKSWFQAPSEFGTL